MRKSIWIVAAFIFIVFPGLALAQQEKPPTCCDLDSVPPDTGSQVTVSDDALLAMGLTRQSFLERTARLFFGDTNPDLLIFDSRYLDAADVALAPSWILNNEARPGNEPALLVHISSVYRLPWEKLGTIDLNALERIWITDGKGYVEVTFRKSSE